jgi:nitroreductase
MPRALFRQSRDGFNRRLALLFASRPALAKLFYGWISPRFTREQFAVIQGRARFVRASRVSSDPLLRRCIHRLEKGLLMRPRAPTFAEDYIGEAVSAFLVARAIPSHDPEEVAWAQDVLTEYFRVVQPTATTDSAKCRFTDATPDPTKIPRPRGALNRSDVSPEAFLQLCRQRRSVRWFDSRPVPRELIEKAVTAASEAPSACNRQPYFFRLFEGQENTAAIAALAMGTRGYREQIPALVVVLGDLSAIAEERDRHLPYIDASLAAMQFMLALETLGLSSCPINWPDVEELEQKMERALELPPYVRPIMLIAIGYADPSGLVAYSAKKPVRILLRTDNDYRS